MSAVQKLSRRAADFDTDGSAPDAEMCCAYLDAVNQVLQITYEYADPPSARAEMNVMPAPGNDEFTVMPILDESLPACPDCGDVLELSDWTIGTEKAFLRWVCRNSECDFVTSEHRLKPGGDHADV